MPIKKFFFPVLFITTAMILFNACNLPNPESGLPSTIPSGVPVIPTHTIVPSPTPIPSATPFISIIPSVTFTLFYNPTFTSTPQWSVCPGIVITLTNTVKGDKLHILRCEDGLEYDLGPLANGVYAVGPNDKFLVYVAKSGFIYAARIGDRLLNPLFNLAQEREFTAFNKRDEPDFTISFSGGDPTYRLVLFEKKYDQKRVYELPTGITK